MQIEIKPGKFKATGKAAILVQTPYHPDFPEKAKALGGYWDGVQRWWTFDARDEPDVRALCLELFGTDGSTPVPTVDLEVSLDGWPDTGELWLVGRQLIRRTYGGVRFGESVRVLAGGFTDTSRRSGQLRWQQGTVLLVRDVPKSLVEKLSEADWGHVRFHGAAAPTEIPKAFRDALEGLS